MISFRTWSVFISLGVFLAGCGSAHSSLAPQFSSPSGTITIPTAASRSPATFTPPPMLGLDAATRRPMDLRKPQSDITALNFTQLPGSAVRVAASNDGFWVLSGAGPPSSDKAIYHYLNSTRTYVQVPGAATRIAVDPSGNPWVVNAAGGIYHLVNGTFTGIAGGASDLSVDANGSLYVISSIDSGSPFGRGIYEYVNGTWTQLQGAGTTVAASIDASGTYPGPITPGGFYVTNSQGGIYYHNPGTTGFLQLSGGAIALAPTANGGLFALGDPGAVQHGIYYNNLTFGTWTAEPGAAVSLSANSSNVYAIGAAGGIYVSPLSTAVGTFRITGSAAPASFGAIDGIMQSYMTANNARAAELALVRGGQVLFAHAYTNSSDPAYPTTMPSSIMRLASNSKPFAIVAANTLVAAGTISRSAAAFPYLGVAKPLLSTQTPDARINQITIGQLIDFDSGLHDESAGDPAFQIRSIENQANDTAALTKSEFLRYIYGLPLLAAPGSTYASSNAGPFVLGRVIEKATGQVFMDYVNTTLLNPLGITDAVASATNPVLRSGLEVTYDDDPGGPYLTTLLPTTDLLLPCPDGGATLFGELLDSSIAVAISAQSWARFLQHAYFVPGSTGSYTGSVCGTASYAEPLSNNMVWTVQFNRRTETFSPSSSFVMQIENVLRPL